MPYKQMKLINDFVIDLEDEAWFDAIRYGWLEMSNEEYMVDYEMMWDLDYQVMQREAWMEFDIEEMTPKSILELVDAVQNSEG